MGRLVLILAIVYGSYQAWADVEMTMVPDVHPMFVKEGSSFKLTCSVKNLPSNQDVEMLYNYHDPSDSGFTVEKGTSSVTMTKDDVQQGDAGTYHCTAGKTERVITMQVIAVLTRNSNVTVGENVTIKCEPDTVFENMDIIWSKDGKKLADVPGVKDRLKLSDKNKTLTLTKAVEGDAGEYTCQIVFLPNYPSVQSFNETIKMFGKPYFKAGDGDKEIAVGSNTTIDLNCDALGYPKPDVTWLKDEEVIQSDSRIKLTDTESGSRLHISKPVVEDSGTYMCNVENSLGRKQRSFKISTDGVINSATYLSLGLSQLILLVSVMILTYKW